MQFTGWPRRMKGEEREAGQDSCKVNIRETPKKEGEEIRALSEGKD